MTAPERRLVARSFIVGAILSLAVATLGASGALEWPENRLYDLRTRFCQGRHPPTKDLVHYDIDEAALKVVGGWPWPRKTIARMVDELHAADAKAIGIDVLFSERRQPFTNQPPDITEDSALAESLKNSGSAQIAASFIVGRPPARPPGYAAMVTAIVIDPTLDETLANPTGPGRLSPRELSDAVSEALASRVTAAVSAGATTLDAVRAAIFGGKKVSRVRIRQLEREYAHSLAVTALAAKSPPKPSLPGLPRLLPSIREIPPLAEFTNAAAGCGSVDYIPSADGVVRAVPLYIDDGAFVVPHMSLRLACQFLRVPANGIRLQPDRVLLSPPGRPPIDVPVRTIHTSAAGTTGMFMDVPLFGTGDWLKMYDYPNHAVAVQHHSAAELWQISDTRRALAKDILLADAAIKALRTRIGEDAVVEFNDKAKQWAPDDPNPRIEEIRATLTNENVAKGIEELNSMSQVERADLKRPAREFLAAANAAPGLRTALVDLKTDLASELRELRDAVKGKAVLIGFTAVATPDFHTTSLHARCPGVVIHGAIFNAIVTGRFLRYAPLWEGWTATLLVGLVVTAASALLPGRWSLPLVLTIVMAYLALNGWVLFARSGLVLPAAAPLAAGVVVWPALTSMRLRFEAAERARISRRLSYYADTELADYVSNHPEQVRFEGQMRDLTVGVTDLAGFTSLTDSLREEAVKLLNRYMDEMVPIIRRRRGYVNKFLGDGIMFFFGAPIPNREHALAAVDTLLEMQQAVQTFNEQQQRQGQPTFGMRGAISSGLMVVGDAGSKIRSDYTVLGDPVNLCFRLEAANKTFGSSALLTEATHRLLGESFLTRPIAQIRVAGRSRAVMTYEALCRIERATEAQHRLVALTQEIVDCFTSARFEECLAAIGRLEAEADESPLTRAYAARCRQYLVAKPADFDSTFDVGK